ncbi:MULTISPECIES: amino acid permease [unclassified Lentimicrobium]|uniref:amino acid permease n=1 Tax=unclassified Lentimicrobium TaxID=2677434 RepID=UPI0015539D72|nr:MULTISPECIES: amino acid permease [unclassified Lentimicrobium]NPD45531.1 amino acid permease [Lentimicrobium sp. S6]NPD84041.1 amino acid permease [Lentimicrobium sp. L6]
MAQAKKFGTFGGVFTPSILTILGVIMYLRLGYIVGEAGLYAVIGLIVIAHVISISTGLSLSSIATDKKIKTGGIYYMLSRSLGLPMGGSIGVTIFLGTALSISLYIVGFVENFLSIEVISDFLAMTGEVNDIRLIGTVVIILLVLIAYISTSIAIKTQFFILGAIALSIVSIIIGALTGGEYQAAEPALTASSNSPDLIVLFAIFFPAVTGFTAGVAMSGDLKSPKDSIPKGTLYAIGLGLVVYIGLALLFAFFVDRELLLTDTNFLLKIAWFSPFVIAGIWGATLSSALGGILGGPRILQAMSQDKVTPSFFGQGVGKNNEPRRALIATFILAELGILIGELDVIAGIVSMFYIAAYGFINLAYVLERWSNSDFRPSLKISIWIGVIGFVASMFVMINLDMLGMLVAFGIMFGIYFFLKRREVQGNMTDVWQSVWTSIIRTSLHRINQKPLKESNWQPNIILFSGGGNARPHLLEMGVNMVGKQGFLSNFDLHLSQDSEFLFSKSKQKISSEIEEQYTGVFTRRQSVSNIYEGIEMIAQTYGFSGVEPNTVMMGWARESNDPLDFSRLVSRLSSLDMNVVLLDYDKKRGWGKQQSIDIWWRGGGHNGNLALSLAKFITLSEDWANAKIRLLIVNQNNDVSNSIHENAQHVLDNLRISADLMIINNEIEQRSFYDIIQVESVDTDLTFLGFTPIIKGEEAKFVEKINILCRNIGTVAIINASSEFKSLSLGELKPLPVFDKSLTKKMSEQKPLTALLDIIQEEKFKPALNKLAIDIEHVYAAFMSEMMMPLLDNQIKWLEYILSSGEKSYDNLISRASSNRVTAFRKTIEVQHGIFMRGQLQYAEKSVSQTLDKLLDEKFELVMETLNRFGKSISNYPYRIKTHITREQLKEAEKVNARMRRKAAWFSPIFRLSSSISYYVHFREQMLMIFPKSVYKSLENTVNHLNRDSFRFENEVFKTLQNISGIFENTMDLALDSIPSEEELLKQKEQISLLMKQLIDVRKTDMEAVSKGFKIGFSESLEDFIFKLNHPLSNSYIDYNSDQYIIAKKSKKSFVSSINIWRNNQNLMDNLNQLNSYLLRFRFSSQNVLNDLNERLSKSIDESISHPLRVFIEVLKVAQGKDIEEQKSFINTRLKSSSSNLDIQLQQSFIDQYNSSLKKIKSSINDFPDLLSIYADTYDHAEQDSEIHVYQEIEVSIKRTLDYMVEKEMMEVRELLINLGQELNAINSQFAEMQQMVLIPSSDKEKNSEEFKKVINSSLEFDEQLSLAFEKANGLLLNIAEKQEYLKSVLLKKSGGLKANLELYPFIRSIQDLKNYIKTETTKRWFGQVTKRYKSVHITLTNQLNKLWYNQSSGLLLAQKLSKSLLEQETRVETLLAFKEEVSPLGRVLKRMPDYYKQLFLRKQFYLNEFWVGREEEQKSFLSTYEQWNSGFGGGIMILGERNSGKSFFSNYIIQKLEVKGEVFYINPPYTGSVSVSELLKNFQNATENNGSIAKIFNDIPTKSIFFFDDLELWWEKSSGGMKVIEQLMNIINRYGNQHLFVVMGNIHSFRLMNRYKKIESNFLKLIELRPFNARQLKEVVMKRHSTSSLSFNINNIPEARYRSWNYARLFSRLFNYSEGNPGVTLQAWIKSATDVDKSVVSIAKPKLPDTAPLRFLETEWMIFILHFILHKRMNLSKLVRVSQETRVDVIKKVRVLKRAGILVEIGDDILDIDPYVLPFLRKALVKRELL